MESAVLDSCVLYSAPLRDLFMYVAEIFQPKWSTEIHAEWMRNVLVNRPDLTHAQLVRTRDLMNQYGRDCLVTRYRRYVETVSLPDPDDRHVVAVAIASKTAKIVTFNLKDFPAASLGPHGIVAVHPDVFAMSLYESNTNDFISLVKRHRAGLSRPPKTEHEYLATLASCGLSMTAARLQVHANSI